MKVGIAADHGGCEMKQKIYILLNAKGHQVVDFGNLQYTGTMIIRTLPSRWLAPSQTELWNEVSCSAAAASGRPSLPTGSMGYARQSVTMISQLAKASRMMI